MGTLSIIGVLIKVLPTILSLIQSVIDHMRIAEAKGVGRQEAIDEALTIQTEELKLATRSMYEGEASHNAHPDDDSGFDQDFKRND